MSTQDVSYPAGAAPGDTASSGFPSHSVQFYGSERGLITALGNYLERAIRARNACLIIATPEHRDALVTELNARGLSQKKHVLYLDAAETLSRLMLHGSPDPGRCHKVIEGAITSLSPAGKGRRRKVVAYGEMVALLWEQGKPEAAIRLEQLWNHLLSEHPVSLRCGYPLQAFDRASHAQFFQQICAEHSQVVPGESYTALITEEQRGRAISLLQQKALALEGEVAQRKRAEEALRINEERLRLTQKAAHIGAWELDLETDGCILSEEAAEMLGLMKGCGTSADLLGCMYYSGDRENFERCLHLAATKSRDFEAEFRLTRNGQVCWIYARGKSFYNQGRPLLLGVLLDITESKNAQHQRDPHDTVYVA